MNPDAERQDLATSFEPLPGSPRGADSRASLSPAQDWMWRWYKAVGPSPAFHLPIRLNLRGDLSFPALRSALNDVWERHSVLRAVHEPLSGEIRQIPVSEAPEWGVSTAEPEPVAALVEDELRERFDPARAPGLRVRLFAESEDSHILLLVAHHLMVDAWSVRPLVRDLFRAYKARRESSRVIWPTLPPRSGNSQGSDTGTRPESWKKAQEFWGKTLADLPKRKRALQVFPSKAPLQIDADLHKRLVSLSSARRVSLFMLLQTAISVLLARRGFGVDIPIGTVVSGRNGMTSDLVVASFANLVLLRAAVDPTSGFDELLERVRGTDLEAFACQGVPFGRVLDGLSPDHALRLNPVPQVMFTVRGHLSTIADVPGLDVSIAPVSAFACVSDLGFDLSELRSPDGRPAGITGEFHYQPNALDRDGADEMLRELVELLARETLRPGALLPPRPAQAPTPSVPVANTASHPQRRPHVEPRYSVEQLMARIWEQMLDVRSIGMGDDFFALGGDQRLLTQMLNAVEQSTGVCVASFSGTGKLTLDELTDELLRRVEPQSLVEIQPGDACACAPFIYMHGDLSGAGLYVRDLARGLGPDQPVLMLQQHGLNGRHVPSSIQEMAADHMEEVRRVRPHGPYRLGGHCSGSLIAFEMACLFTEQNEHVEALVLVDPPCQWAREGGVRWLPKPPEPPPGWRENPEIRGPILFNQYAAPVRAYRPRPYPSDVTVIWAQDHSIDGVPPNLAWRKVARQVTIHQIPGNHFTIIGRGVERLASQIRAAFDLSTAAALPAAAFSGKGG